jgi:hypothetical protein
LSDDQKAVLATFNTSDAEIFWVEALAGTGKIVLISCVLQAMLPHLAGAREALVLLLPNRELRDETVREVTKTLRHFAGDEERPTCLWLGRPSDNPGGRTPVLMWEEALQELVERKLEPITNTLKAYEDRASAFLREASELAPGAEAEHWRTEVLNHAEEANLDAVLETFLQECRYLPQFLEKMQAAKDLLSDHTREVVEIMESRNAIIDQLTKDIHVVIGTRGRSGKGAWATTSADVCGSLSPRRASSTRSKVPRWSRS